MAILEHLTNGSTRELSSTDSPDSIRLYTVTQSTQVFDPHFATLLNHLFDHICALAFYCGGGGTAFSTEDAEYLAQYPRYGIDAKQVDDDRLLATFKDECTLLLNYLACFCEIDREQGNNSEKLAQLVRDAADRVPFLRIGFTK